MTITFTVERVVYEVLLNRVKLLRKIFPTNLRSYNSRKTGTLKFVINIKIVF